MKKYLIICTTIFKAKVKSKDLKFQEKSQFGPLVQGNQAPKTRQRWGKMA